MAFFSKKSRGIGTTFVGIESDATPPSGKTWVVIGMTVCNVSASPVNVTAQVHDASNDTKFLNDFPLPVGETVVPEGSLGKIVLANGDSIQVKSSVATSLDVILSVLES